MFALVVTPILSLIQVQPVSAQPTTVLTPKWTRSGLGTNWEGGLVIGDVTGDGQEDIVYAGCSQDTLYVLDGDDGSTIATYTNSRLGGSPGSYSQPQLYDVDGDGVLDILLPMFYVASLAALKYDGDSSLQALWVCDVGVGGSSSSASIMAKPVAGDIDNDGHLDIFQACADVSPGDNDTDNDGIANPLEVPPQSFAYNGYDGTIRRINYLGQIVATNFAWRPCSGGLSLADTDNDGVFELYQGDRDIDYGDGNYGKGERSFWADNLTQRWNRLDALTSSQAPAIVDVNGDGILDIVTGMYSEMVTLNSTNGQWISRWTWQSDEDDSSLYGGQIFENQSISVHYGITVYDIDGDGHLELLCNDGDHDEQPYTDVFDLVTGEMDAQLYHFGQVFDDRPRDAIPPGDMWKGTSKWSPLVADIDPTHPGMEIISVPEGTGLDGGNYWHGAIIIWSSSYEYLQDITRAPGSTPGTYSSSRLLSQLGYPTVQDIDGDGLLELVTDSSTGVVYAFDTSAPAPGYSSSLPGSHRIRSEVTFFSEKRTGVAVYEPMPWAPDYWTAPLVAPVTPGDNAINIPQSTSSLSFRLREHQSQAMNYTVTTSPDVGSTNGSSVGDPYEWGVYTLNFNKALQYDTTYRWTVTVTDGTYTTQRTYTFHTELAPNQGNTVPTQGDPTLVAQDGVGMAISNFTCTNGTTTDTNGDQVTNIYNWAVNDQQVANLILPFNTRNEVSTKDYSAYGNDGTVTGAIWTPNGKVGGAYLFDGKDDAILISDGGVGYYDNQTHSDYNRELGGGGTWEKLSVEAWIYLTEYNNGSRIVAKLPSYELGFQTNSESRFATSTTLMASVWPETFTVALDDNSASTARKRSVTYNADFELNTWYHVAFSYESGVGLKLYVNGESVANATGVSGPLESSLGEPIYIGRLVQPFAGMIDEVRIYPYALSAVQMNNSYMSTKDGLSTNSTFCPVGIATPVNTISCSVIPTDSYGDGLPHSASMPVVNSPPVASNPLIYPVRDRALRLDNEDLRASYDYTDADGDAELNSQIRWYINGASQSQYDNQLQISASDTAIGQTWYFTVEPRDSRGGIGLPITSETITIRGNVAPSTGTPSLDSIDGGTDYDDENIVGTSAATTDADSDSTTNIYRWTHGDVSMTNLQMSFDTEVPKYYNANGTTNDYSGYNNHGTVVGASWTQDGIVGGAFSFDGNDFIRVQETGNSLGGDGGWSEASVEFWVRATGTTSTERAILLHDADFSTSSSSPYGLSYRVDYRSYGSSYLVTWYVYNNTGVNSVSFRDYVDANEWHHVLCTYEDGIGLKLYMDGLEKASILATGSINATIDDILDIGGYGSGGTDFSGLLDEVNIYPKALSAIQVFQRYTDIKDGLSDSGTITGKETTAGDTWVCQVIPNDSWADGAMQASTALSVTSDGNGAPSIFWYSPAEAEISVDEGASLAFMQFSSDPDNANDELTYSWTLDTVEQATTKDWTYMPDFNSQGPHTIRVTVSDGSLTDYQEWTVNVNDVPVESRNLTILAAANGNTEPALGLHEYAVNTDASVQAIPDAGYMFSYWLLNGTNYGPDNPCTITMNENYELQPVFEEIPPLLEDGFESGDFSQWSGSSTTAGETATIVTNLRHHGTYGARFTTNGDGGTERAYLYKDIDPQTEVYVRGYFNIQAGLPMDAVDNRFNVFSFVSGTNDNTIASMGVRRSGGADVWYINSLVGTWYASSGPLTDQWYCLEFYVKVDATNGVLTAWVNNQTVLNQTGINTATVASAIDEVRCELVYVNGVTHPLDVYGDCVVIDTSYIGTETDAPTPISVSVDTNRERYTKWSYVGITVTAEDEVGSSLANADITLTVYDTHGRVAWTATGTTGADGTATFTYKLVFNAQMGEYTVAATASLAGHTGGSGQATFYSLG